MKKLISLIVSISFVLCMMTTVSFADDEVDATINHFELSAPQENTQINNGMQVSTSVPLKFDYDIKVDKNNIKNGDYINVNVAREFDIYSKTQLDEFDVVTEDGTTVGKAKISSTPIDGDGGGGTAKITFNSNAENKLIKNINLTFYGLINKYAGNAYYTPTTFKTNINGKHEVSKTFAIMPPVHGAESKMIEAIAEHSETPTEAEYTLRINGASKDINYGKVTSAINSTNGIIKKVILNIVDFNDWGEITNTQLVRDITDTVNFNEDRTEMSVDFSNTNRQQYIFKIITSVTDNKNQGLTSSFKYKEKWYARVTEKATTTWRQEFNHAVASVENIVTPSEPEHNNPNVVIRGEDEIVNPHTSETPSEPETPNVTPSEPSNPSVTPVDPATPDEPSVTPSEPEHNSNVTPTNPNVIIRGEEEIVNPYSSVRAEENIVTNKVEINKTNSVMITKKSINNSPKTADTTNWAVMLTGIILPLITLIMIGGYCRKKKQS